MYDYLYYNNIFCQKYSIFKEIYYYARFVLIISHSKILADSNIIEREEQVYELFKKGILYLEASIQLIDESQDQITYA